MKIFILMMLVILTIGCSETKVIDGIEYDTFGLYNENEKRNPDIVYEIVIGNVIWSVILVETIIAPAYFILFDLYQPVAKLDSMYVKGQVLYWWR